MTNPLRKLPRDVLEHVREFASDRVEPHPTAAMIKSLTFLSFPAQFTDDGNFWGASLVVRGDDLTHRTRKCFNTQCGICRHPEWSCGNAVPRTMATNLRRYVYSNFNGYGGWTHYSMWHGEESDDDSDDDDSSLEAWSPASP